ncbi:hypothetical protein GBAR_LOCUS3436 [Geodia barretti]|uniref:Uncharacterized protein n=2 Tax=Geodia barretti TaxID=519541 RepID=A0AA35R453_GEOBA|nr:hypothetical protein GBAR_LOCUS3436 [Geodia barretti]
MSRRRGGSARSAASWLLFWLFWCGCCVEGRSSGPGECPARPYRPPELSLRDRGGLSSLVASAESTRSVVVGGNLPYEFISTRAREAYNGSRPLTPSVFVAEWTRHTQNALFVGGFVLFVGVLFPAAAMALWTFWECCYEDDEEEEQENRNLTLQSQVVVWSLAGALIVALIVLLVMVGILLGANSWITRGVTQGGAIVERTIPQLVELRDSALQNLDELLIEGYDNLTLDLQTSRLDEIPHEVSNTVSARHSTTADILSQSISAFFSERPRLLYNLTVSVTTALSLLHDLTSSLNNSLVSLRDNCSLLTNEDGNSSLSLLSTPCNDFTFDPSSLVPDSRSWNEVGGVSEDGRSFLSQLESLLSRDALPQTDRIPLPPDLLLEYLNEMTQDLSSQVNSTTETYFSSLGGNLSQFTEEVAIFYNSSLTLHSQPQMELYLGPRHLGNWEWFRSALTVTFAVLIFAGSLPLLAALGRGLYFVSAIYRYSDSATYDHGAHQSGMVIKKIAFSLCVISIISASFTGVCLSLAGVMGKACGNHNNFSELLENIVDNPRTWTNKDTSFYPLAAVMLNLSHYPLRVSDTLTACRSNASLFRAFHLEQRYDLEDRIWLSPTKKRQYRQEMQDIH